MAITNGYCSLSELKAALTSPGTTISVDAPDDGVMEDMVEAASRMIDAYFGRQFYVSAAETRLFSVPDAEETNDTRLLWLDKDLITLTTLTNGDGTVIAAADYNLLPRNGSPKYAIRLKPSSDVIWECDSNSSPEYVISVLGNWGYAAAVPDDIKELCVEIARNLYKSRFGENAEAVSTITAAGVVVTPRAMPSWAKTLDGKYKRTV
jgi:hypothetical protein